MTNHPNRSKQTTTIRFWSATTGSHVTHEGTVVRSGSGYGAEPEYGVLYRLADGQFLGGVRHRDRGDLMTEVCYAASARRAMPARWR